jgi:hypothetical protein
MQHIAETQLRMIDCDDRESVILSACASRGGTHYRPRVTAATGLFFVAWLGRAKALGFLAGYVFIPLLAYHCRKGAVRVVQLGPPIQVFC